ncbi:MAG: TIGR03915 family putative DNA repair protein [Clostridium sp.]
MVYTFDGTFEGFLTCVYESYYNVWPENIMPKDKYIPSFLESETYIVSCNEKYRKVKKAIEEKISIRAYKTVYTVFLSDNSEAYINILNYIKLGFKLGSSIDNHKQNSTIIYIDKIYHRVKSEAHRFTGFVRFKDINGVLYGCITPDHDILYLISDHFRDRFKGERFIIHDNKRNKALINNMGELSIIEGFNIDNIDYSKDVYETLWISYFKSTNIKERENLKHQRGMMPKRYWGNLTEMK